ncbi:MAG TPA: zinc dependent phospholipase C family protein, partial [Gemmatimonadales bacterium]|nr:zinc dependent phospholipase C family protein [Gemmatimonadales bacterium]
MKRLGAVALLALAGLVLFPGVAHAWTPGTHIFLGESVLANLHQIPTIIADLLRAFPYDFLYGNIAADTSMAKKYAPVGRHCHAWHVGQEIFDL